jgi:hypothetical protein
MSSAINPQSESALPRESKSPLAERVSAPSTLSPRARIDPSQRALLTSPLPKSSSPQVVAPQVVPSPRERLPSSRREERKEEKEEKKEERKEEKEEEKEEKGEEEKEEKKLEDLTPPNLYKAVLRKDISLFLTLLNRVHQDARYALEEAVKQGEDGLVHDLTKAFRFGPLTELIKLNEDRLQEEDGFEQRQKIRKYLQEDRSGQYSPLRK